MLWINIIIKQIGAAELVVLPLWVTMDRGSNLEQDRAFILVCCQNCEIVKTVKWHSYKVINNRKKLCLTTCVFQVNGHIVIQGYTNQIYRYACTLLNWKMDMWLPFKDYQLVSGTLHQSNNRANIQRKKDQSFTLKM
jgi:hypothetical protein